MSAPSARIKEEKKTEEEMEKTQETGTWRIAEEAGKNEAARIEQEKADEAALKNATDLTPKGEGDPPRKKAWWALRNGTWSFDA